MGQEVSLTAASRGRGRFSPVAEVTEIRVKSEEGGRARVYLDGVYWLSARAEELERAGLVAGAQVSDPDEAARALLLEAAKSFLLRSLGARAQTERELDRKLARRGVPPEVAAEALLFVRSYGFTDDAALARQVCASVRASGYGAGRAEAKLRARGVAPDEVRAAIAEVFAAEPEEEVERASRALGTRYELPEERQKAFAFLCRRGFSIDAARRAVDA
jgi:regulatory protein